MSMIVGITGGIGSGKTTIANFFKEFNIPVYNADEEAKKIMNSKAVMEQIISHFGSNAYKNKELNRDYLRTVIFNNDEARDTINKIVHPEVGKHFLNWVTNQESPYVLKEAAIIFEAGLTQQYDYIITVVADKKLRIKRLLTRPELNADIIKSIMSKQWSDTDKIAKSDYIIYNDDLEEAKKQVEAIHFELLEKSAIP